MQKGKLEFEPDGYMLGLIRDPQAVENGPDIKPLDSETLRDAFSLREGPIPGVKKMIQKVFLFLLKKHVYSLMPLF